MVQTHQLKLLQTEKTHLFLDKNSYIFFIQCPSFNTTKMFEVKQKLLQIDPECSLLSVTNSIATQMNLSSLPAMEGPNIFLGGKDLEKAGQMYTFLKATPSFLVLGACIEKQIFHHLEVEVYFKSIYSNNIYTTLVAELQMYTSSSIQFHVLPSFMQLQYVLAQQQEG